MALEDFNHRSLQVDADGNERDYWASLMPDDVAAYEKRVKLFRYRFLDLCIWCCLEALRE